MVIFFFFDLLCSHDLDYELCKFFLDEVFFIILFDINL